SGDQNHRINYTNENGLDGLHIQGNQGVEIGTQHDGTVMTVKEGNVGIGTSTPQYKLDVSGNNRIKGNLNVCKNVFADELIATNPDWCDFVFDEEYELMPMDSLKRFIEINKHLPDIQKGELIEKNGLKLKEMNQKMMQKIEELTLYIIKLEERINQLENK
ncbi:MAG: hypothetical protein ACOCWW_01220, partial [Bacteroidota bacterium]